MTSKRAQFFFSVAVFVVAFLIFGLVKQQNSKNSLQNSGKPFQPFVSTNPNPQPTATQPTFYIPITNPVKVQAPLIPVPAQIVVQFAPDTTTQERQAYIESVGGTVLDSIDALDTVVLNIPKETAQQPLPASPVVTQSEPNYYVASQDDGFVVNDPRYTEQWALPAIGAPSAWAQLPTDMPKVTVAVIDSGICASHPDLTGRIEAGWDFVENDAVPQDDFGHGCAVAGVIAANTGNGIGIAGVAPNAQIMPLRVLNANGLGSYSDVAAAIVYAADNGAQVINLSLGGSSPSSTLENAVNYALSKGVTLVAAAGNNGTEGVLYPAAYPDVVAVGSVDPNMQHSSFSNYGAQVDIWAPGRDILTTKRDGSYVLMSGTSFAAPYVAGAEALEIFFGKSMILNGDLLSLLISNDPKETLTQIPTVQVTSSISPTPVETQIAIDVILVPGTFEVSINEQNAVITALTISRSLLPIITYFTITDVREMDDHKLLSVLGLARVRENLNWSLEDDGVWFGLVP